MVTSLIISIITMAGISLLITQQGIPEVIRQLFLYFNRALFVIIGGKIEN